MQYTKIVKLASGNIQFQDASNNPVKTIQPAANLELLPDNAGVKVKQWQGENTDILISQVLFTRLDPAGDVAFSGTAQDLMTLLGDSFFFELEGGGGGAIVYPEGVTVSGDNYLAETTTGAGTSSIIHTIDTLKNQVIYVRAEAVCGKTGVTGNAVRFAGRAFSVNGGVVTLSSSVGPDPNITTTINPTLAITTSGSNIILTATNATQNTSWFISYTITIFKLP
jgi:hypothetical protein